MIWRENCDKLVKNNVVFPIIGIVGNGMMKRGQNKNKKLKPKRAIDILKRSLKLYHPDFVSFFNCKRMYKEFWNNTKRILDMVEENANSKKEEDA